MIEKHSRGVPDPRKYNKLNDWGVRKPMAMIGKEKRQFILSKYTEKEQKNSPSPQSYSDVGSIKDKFTINKGGFTGRYNLCLERITFTANV